MSTCFIISKSAKTKPQWLGFWGGDDGAYCAFPDTLASSEGHAPIPIPICPPLTQNPVSAPALAMELDREKEFRTFLAEKFPSDKRGTSGPLVPLLSEGNFSARKVHPIANGSDGNWSAVSNGELPVAADWVAVVRVAVEKNELILDVVKQRLRLLLFSVAFHSRSNVSLLKTSCYTSSKTVRNNWQLENNKTSDAILIVTSLADHIMIVTCGASANLRKYSA